MSSRAEFKQAFRVIKDTKRFPDVVPDSEIDYSVWHDRKESFRQVLDKIIESIDLPRWRTWIFNVDIASKGLIAYWANVSDDIFRAHEVSTQGDEEYNGRWIKIGEEELCLTVEKFEGPVDVTRYRVQRRTFEGTLFEESELVFDLDEQGRLEEGLNPLRITNRLIDYKVDGVIVEHEVRYIRGGIHRIRIRRRQKERAGDVPNIEKTTEFLIPPLI